MLAISARQAFLCIDCDRSWINPTGLWYIGVKQASTIDLDD
jgi:hypothetical protein